jgi:hypothetical protein
VGLLLFQFCLCCNHCSGLCEPWFLEVAPNPVMFCHNPDLAYTIFARFFVPLCRRICHILRCCAVICRKLRYFKKFVPHSTEEIKLYGVYDRTDNDSHAFVHECAF